MTSEEIESKAKEYADRAWSTLGVEFNEDHNTFENIVIDAFMAGAKSERAELLRWRDPKEELPDDTEYVLIKEMKSYWHYTFLTSDVGVTSYGFGIKMNENGNEFDFYKFHLEYPRLTLLSVNQISEEQFNKFSELINNNQQCNAR